MKPATRLIALSALLLASCHPAPHTTPPAPEDANAKVVLTFLRAYGQRDLEGMMACLEDGATFVGTGSVLSKPQIRDFFQASFQKHPKLRVEVGAVKVLQETIRASVRVETESVWADTWIFEMRNRRIHSYTLASGRR
jgi:ketosteroid isomerase-like protein